MTVDLRAAFLSSQKTWRWIAHTTERLARIRTADPIPSGGNTGPGAKVAS